jgi:hypothetical protein
MITKKSSANGMSGGHGMQILDLSGMSSADLFSEVKNGHTAYCPCCGTDYKLDKEIYTDGDILNVISKFRKEGCIECGEVHWKKIYAAGYHKVFVKVGLEIGGRVIEAIRIPSGYRTSQLKALVDLEKKAAKVEEQKEYVEIGGKKVLIQRFDEVGVKKK